MVATLNKDTTPTYQPLSWLPPLQYEDGSDSQDYGSDSRYSQELELRVKMRKNQSAVETHDWRDVLAIGRVRESEQTEAKELLLQLGSAVREVFARQPTRRFIHAFTLAGTTMEIWVFDRSGPYSGATFNVHEEPEKFVPAFCGDQIPYDDRVLHVLVVTPSRRPLDDFGSILELLECLRNAIKAHRSLYMESGILHRHISINIIVTEPAKADGYMGMFIDLDLARDITKYPSGQRYRTDTIEFMAIE
ncbi:hypothetical protein E4U59_002178, partial [Claviceps monticola]